METNTSSPLAAATSSSQGDASTSSTAKSGGLTEEDHARLLAVAEEMLAPSLATKPPKLFIIVGAGVSMASASAPGWSRLLEMGYDFAEARYRTEEEKEILDDIADLTSKGKLVEAADILQGLLTPSDFAEFLQSAFEPYHTHQMNEISRRIYARLYVLVQMGARIATTNYDLFIEDTLRLQAFDWMDDNQIDFFDSCNPVADRGVLHLHGMYKRPGNVIFGTADYKRISTDSPALDDSTRRHREVFEHCLRDLLIKGDNRVLFIGCGDTLTDPHFKPLFEFCRMIDERKHRRHVHLCADKDYPHWNKSLPPSVRAIPYGTHAQLSFAIKEVFNWVFCPVDAAVSERRRRRMEAWQARVRYDDLKINFPDGIVYICPADGVSSEYDEEMMEYYHVFEGFVWKRRRCDDFTKTTDTFYQAIKSERAIQDRIHRVRRSNSVDNKPAQTSVAALRAQELLDELSDGFAARIADAAAQFTRCNPSSYALRAFCDVFIGDSRCDTAGRGVIHYLVLNEAIDLLRAIIESQSTNFDIHKKDSDWMTATHLAVFMNLPSSLEILLREPSIKTSLAIKDVKGRTPFKMAWRLEHHECLRLLAPHTDENASDPPNMRSVLQRLKQNPRAKIYKLSEDDLNLP